MENRGGDAPCVRFLVLHDSFVTLRPYWPQITRYDERAFPEKCKEHGVAIYIHPDRQRLVPRSTPSDIDAKIRQYAKRYRDLGGGGIFYIEIENDAPFENVKTLIEAVDQYR